MIFRLALFLSLMLVQHSLEACTAFQLQSQDGAYLYCRSLEFSLDLQSNVLIVPRGTEYQGSTPNRQPGLKWKSTYGFVGLNQWFLPNLVSDGMNEKGLVVGMLYLPGFAEYQKPDLKRQNETIAAWELAAYLLSTCATLEDVRLALTKIYVAEQLIPGVDISLPLHFYIGDSRGKVLIVEYVKGERREYDDPLRILTNSPPFDWHMQNLSNYVNLSPTNIAGIDLDGYTISSLGQGSGALGIPGDYTPPSRFVRAAFYSHWAQPAKLAGETACLGFHVLNTFDIFSGAILGSSSQVEMPKPFKMPNPETGKAQHPTIKNTEYTQWTVVHDLTHLKTYFRSYEGLQVQMVDLKKIDFTQPGLRQIDIEKRFIVDDVTDKSHPLILAK